jgi:DNA-binding MarR family transcriptional regulator
MVTELHSVDLIKKLALLLHRICDAELQPWGLTCTQFLVLRAVAESPDASLARLAESWGISRQAVHQVLRELRAASLVVTAERAQGRGRPVELAAAGQLLLATATDVVNRAEERMLAGIAPHDRDLLATLLHRCIDNLETAHPQAVHVPPAHMTSQPS